MPPISREQREQAISHQEGLSIEERSGGDILASVREAHGSVNDTVGEVRRTAEQFRSLVEQDRNNGDAPENTETVLQEMRDTVVEAETIAKRFKNALERIKKNIGDRHEERVYQSALKKMREYSSDVLKFLKKHSIGFTAEDSREFYIIMKKRHEFQSLRRVVPYIPHIESGVVRDIFFDFLSPTSSENDIADMMKFAPEFYVKVDGELAERMIDYLGYRGARYVAEHLADFGRGTPALADKMIEILGINGVSLCMEHAEMFGIQKDARFAGNIKQRFGDEGLRFIAYHAGEFENLSPDIVEDIIHCLWIAGVDLVCKNPHVVLRGEYADWLIDAYGAEGAQMVLDYITRFQRIGSDAAQKIVDLLPQSYRQVLEHADRFGLVVDEQLIRRILAEKGTEFILRNRDLLPPLSADIWFDMLRASTREEVDIIMDGLMGCDSRVNTTDVRHVLDERYQESSCGIILKYATFLGQSLDAEFMKGVLATYGAHAGRYVLEQCEPYLTQFHGLDKKFVEEVLFMFCAPTDSLPFALHHADVFGIVADQAWIEDIIQRFGHHMALAVLHSLHLIRGSFDKRLIAKLIDFSRAPAVVWNAVIKSYRIAYTDENLYKNAVRELIKESSHNIRFLLSALDNLRSFEAQEIYDMYDQLGKNENFSTPREKQLAKGGVWATAIRNGHFEYFDRYQSTESGAREKVSDVFKGFCEMLPVGKKGKTILGLLAFSLYEEGMSTSEFVERIGQKTQQYQQLLRRYDVTHIPQGFRASLGLEYEITRSIAQEYDERFRTDLREDIMYVSDRAGIGQGRDAIHELATQPTDNPLALLLELKLLQDLGFIDFNFKEYEKAGHGFHLTLGGEKGLDETDSVNVLQNSIIIAGWGGLSAGEDIGNVNRGRSMPVRARGTYGSALIFKNQTPSVELRSLSLDAWEPFERTIITSYLSAVAVQVYERYIAISPHECINNLGRKVSQMSDAALYHELLSRGMMREGIEHQKVRDILMVWLRCVSDIEDALLFHNENFYDENYTPSAYEAMKKETGSPDEEFFQRRLHIDPMSLFSPLSANVINRLATINNLFLKPSRQTHGDQTNALAMLQTTKIGNKLEDSAIHAADSVFDTKGKQRKGYYVVQNASRDMIVHRVQQILLGFQEKMNEILARQDDVLQERDSGEESSMRMAA